MPSMLESLLSCANELRLQQALALISVPLSLFPTISSVTFLPSPNLLLWSRTLTRGFPISPMPVLVAGLTPRCACATEVAGLRWRGRYEIASAVLHLTSADFFLGAMRRLFITIGGGGTVMNSEGEICRTRSRPFRLTFVAANMISALLVVMGAILHLNGLIPLVRVIWDMARAFIAPRCLALRKISSNVMQSSQWSALCLIAMGSRGS